MGEFEIIARYFASGGPSRDDVVLGVGDDGAVLRCAPGMELVVAIDTLVEGVHFPVSTPAEDVGFKALAVNLSDLAAMGAEPAWATLALTLPRPDEAWVAGFSRGFFELAQAHRVALVGGDTTRGPLTVSVQVHGWVPAGQALRRRGAVPGDLVYVSGTLGDAGLGLAHRMGRCALPSSAQAVCVTRLNRPQPRLALGRALRGIATSAIDVSDGLSADLSHILEQSGVGARLNAEALPLSHGYTDAVAACPGFFSQASSGPSPRHTFALTAGDDYELCFTVAPGRGEALIAAAQEAACAVTCIGEIQSAPGLRLCLVNGDCQTVEPAGYAHF